VRVNRTSERIFTAGQQIPQKFDAGKFIVHILDPYLAGMWVGLVVSLHHAAD
jgi:hypothetical protein